MIAAVEPKRTYLDYNATAPLRAEAREAMLVALDLSGNPSSVHAEGRKARAIVEAARRQVAGLVNAAPKNVVFTSGATEANKTVISQVRFGAVAASGVEHPSVLEAARKRGEAVSILPVDNRGIVDLGALEDWLVGTQHLGERLVSVQWANNETGVIQPIDEIAQVVRAHEARLHVDAVQAAGRVTIDLSADPIAFLTLSSHKIGGPHGAGAIVQGCGGELKDPLLVGGGQESRLRAGTENVAGIAGFGAAAECAAGEVQSIGRLEALRQRIEAELTAMSPEAVVIGKGQSRLGNTLSVALPRARAETLVIAFDLAGVALSSGSACSSGKVARSHVLEAMGLGEQIVQSALRISMGWATTNEDIDRLLEAWSKVMKTDRAARQVA
ncbi:MAG: cysteine desulfurase [Alphaproteobacteria bacterium]|nr:cysteine desulfurase [Alphaproteobacteria bacterium]